MDDDAIPSVSVVIPVFNEAENIERTLQSLKKNIHVSHEVIVVYDSEEDNTLPVLERVGRDDSSLRWVKNNIAAGPSGALRAGFAQARGERVLVVMADLCDDFTQIQYLLSLVPSKADVVCPSRYCPGGAQLMKPSLKVWAPRTAGFLMRLFCGIPTYDPTNSFKLYSSTLLKKIPLTSTVSFSVTLELVAKTHCLGYRIVEVPTTWHDRQNGKTNFKLGRSLIAYSPWFCIALLRNRLFHLPNSWLRFLLGDSRGHNTETHSEHRDTERVTSR